MLGGITKMMSNSTRGENAIKADLMDTPDQIPARNDKPYEGGPQTERKGPIPWHIPGISNA